MGMAFSAIGGLLTFICAIIILIHAFKNEVWKGLVGFFCCFYLWYYMFTEFEHEKKGMIIAGYWIGVALSAVGYFITAGQVAAQIATGT